MSYTMAAKSLVIVLCAALLVSCGAGAQIEGVVTGQNAGARPVVPRTVTIPRGRRGINGASHARCRPAPCAIPVAPTTFTLSGVSNGDGTTSTRQYAVLRPRGLVASPSSRAPAVLSFYSSGNCGYHIGGRWTELSAPDRFVVVAMEVPCGASTENWRRRNIGSLQPRVPNDQAYVAAAVRAIEQCPGECVDPRRVYAVGESGGGSFVGDIMCDPHNSALLRGYFIDSSSLPLYNGVPNCPTPNAGFFVMMALSNYAADQSFYYHGASNSHLDVPAFAAWAAHRLRCRGPRIVGHIGTAVSYSYGAPCAFATHGVAVRTLGVINGGHGWNCQDSDAGTGPTPCPGMPVPPGLGANGKPQTGGLFIEDVFWRMVASGVS